MRYTSILCHYAEIGLKGRNRSFFEGVLINNIKQKLRNIDIKVEKFYGKILITPANNKDLEEIFKIVSNIPGISSLAKTLVVNKSIEDIKKNVLLLLEDIKFDTFKIYTKRSDKKFPIKSTELNKHLGDWIVNNFKKNVDLTNPDIIVYIDIFLDRVFLYINKQSGLGGLPVGSSGKGVVLISGGFDSPVAAYLMIRRGIRPFYLHFHSYPHTSKQSIEKVKELLLVLSKYTNNVCLYLCPFAEIQKEIVIKSPDKFRILLYRRMMMKVANEIVRKHKAHAIITGESLGQVASQTIQNLAAIENASDFPILRPLIGFNKQEIIDLAKQIGTHDISIKAHDDCCSFFMPRHPEIKANLRELEQIERTLPISRWVKELITSCEKIFIK